MPIPVVLIGAAIATGVTGLEKGGKASIKNYKAKELLEDAQLLFDNKKNELEIQKRITARSLSSYGELKIEVWEKQFTRFIELLSNIKDVKINGELENNDQIKDALTEKELIEIKRLSLTANEITKGGIASLGTGALIGVASYSGTAMFASASTGTAISSLTGVAASNATLAWFGGGSLTAGGLGVTGGTMVLGGLIAGPILAVSGVFMDRKAKSNLRDAELKYREIEASVVELQNAIIVLESIDVLAKQYYELVAKLNDGLNCVLNEFDKIMTYYNKGIIFNIRKTILALFGKKARINYSKLNHEEKLLLYKVFQFVEIVKIILEKPLLNEDGGINIETKNYIADNDVSNIMGA